MAKSIKHAQQCGNCKVRQYGTNPEPRFTLELAVYCGTLTVNRTGMALNINVLISDVELMINSEILFSLFAPLQFPSSDFIIARTVTHMSGFLVQLTHGYLAFKR